MIPDRVYSCWFSNSCLFLNFSHWSCSFEPTHNTPFWRRWFGTIICVVLSHSSMLNSTTDDFQDSFSISSFYAAFFRLFSFIFFSQLFLLLYSQKSRVYEERELQHKSGERNRQEVILWLINCYENEVEMEAKKI